MAAIPLFWDTNMAVVTSCENSLYRFCHRAECLEIINYSVTDEAANSNAHVLLNSLNKRRRAQISPEGLRKLTILICWSWNFNFHARRFEGQGCIFNLSRKISGCRRYKALLFAFENGQQCFVFVVVFFIFWIKFYILLEKTVIRVGWHFNDITEKKYMMAAISNKIT